MTRTLRTVIAFLLAVALPNQGVLAATVALCGPYHEHMASVANDYDHSAHGAHEHASHAVLHTPSDDGVATAENVETFTLSAMSCSACAACCVGLALSVREFHLNPLAPSTTLRSSDVFSLHHVFADGPYHPPRYFLA